MDVVAETGHAPRAVRRLTILAQDPSVSLNGRLVRAQAQIPAEVLLPGPCGYRVKVVDYDATANQLYEPLVLGSALIADDDPFAEAPDDILLSDPRFHAQNCYAIAMRILARFEFALGRRLPWGSSGHQLHIAPHAFNEPNAFYSREDRGLFFGYFFVAGQPEPILTCLSHDIVAHETTHAILDGLRAAFMEPSLPDQSAFHEGFCDVVALLSVFALEETIKGLLAGEGEATLIEADKLTVDALRVSTLFGLADQMGQALSGVRGKALRRSVSLAPGYDYMNDPNYLEEHARGELIVAAMMQAFLEIWVRRLSRIGPIADNKKDLSLVIEEGARAADHLLTMAIRAIDYCPPVELAFSDYLSALLTVDREVVPDDRYGYRAVLLKCFEGFGIEPSRSADADGTWKRCLLNFTHGRTHFDSMLRDREEVFRFLWENRDQLELGDTSNIEVTSVRPSFRIAPDGFALRETVAEYVEILVATARELRTDYKITVPSTIPDWKGIRIVGGGTVIFDEYGQVKYHIAHHVSTSAQDREWQSRRLAWLESQGRLDQKADPANHFAMLHLSRGSSAGTVALTEPTKPESREEVANAPA